LSIISIFYNLIFIPIAKLLSFILYPFNSKLKEREKGWKDTLMDLDLLPFKEDGVFRIWFHAASMGEFEQAKPVIERLKNLDPESQIIVSFYSPSGYNNQHNYKHADSVVYMPFDSYQKAKRFINTMNPDIAVFVRYEIWRNHLRILYKRKIPTYLICATIPNSRFLKNVILKPYVKSSYKLFRKIFTVGEAHTTFFQKLKLKTKVFTLTDTRFDRIAEKVEVGKTEKILPDILFNINEFIFIAGSTWQPDEEIIIETVKRFEKENKAKIKLILVPHEPTASHLENIKSMIPHSFFLSQVLDYLDRENNDELIQKFLGKNHIIVDSIGKLLRLYAGTHAAYIGGGFGVGVHSVTEPAGYGIPLASGPNFTNSPDAIELNKLGALSIINDSEDLYFWLSDMINDVEKRNKIGKISKDYVFNACGSSDTILDEILSDYDFSV
jgi:3-deoxy-D-manno-octulosonic-acid transferase